MTKECRVNIELNRWLLEQWDCECDKPQYKDNSEKCPGCICNDPDYFIEDYE